MSFATPPTPESLEPLRQQIDHIDAQLLSLLNHRAKLAIEIGEWKKANQRPIHDPLRESEILNRIEAQNSGPLSPANMRRIFEAIIRENRNLEETRS